MFIPGQATDPAGVYLLQRFDRRRFKVGWAFHPLTRVRALPEFAANEIDVAASRTVWLPSRIRAEQVERAAHKVLAPYSATIDHRGQGRSEWFEQAAHPVAVRALLQMPADDLARRVTLAPLVWEPGKV
jgi:hypothetical protein